MRSRARGATLPEYALLLFAVLLVGAGIYRGLGAGVDRNARIAGDLITSGGTPGIGGGTPGIGGGTPGIGGGTPGIGNRIGGFVRDFARGLILGDFAEGGNPIARAAGQIVGGFIPIVGQIGDIRDLGAAVRDIAQGREGGWTNLGLAAVGVVPGVGDAAKGILRGGDAVRTVAKNGDEVVAGVAGIIRRNADEAAELAKVGEGAADSRGIFAGAVRRGEDGSKRVLVHEPEKSMADGIRKVNDIPADTKVYRVQPSDLPFEPHKSEFFDPEAYGLPMNGKYEALYVSPDKNALEGLRKKQGYFDDNPKNAMHESTIGDLAENAGKNGGEVMVFRDSKLEWSTGIPGYVIVRKLP